MLRWGRSDNDLVPLAPIVLTISLAVHVRRLRPARFPLVAAALCLVTAGLVTRFLNQPINAEVMTWSIQSPPARMDDTPRPLVALACRSHRRGPGRPRTGNSGDIVRTPRSRV